MSAQKFEPNWVSPPGDTLCDLLSSSNLSKNEVAEALKRSVDYVSDLLDGKATLTETVAARLQELTGIGAEFWLRRERQYREDVERLGRGPCIEDAQDWYERLPVSFMRRENWISDSSIEACLNYFGVRDVADWREANRGTLSLVAFRSSSSFDSEPVHVLAWMRRGQQLASSRDIAAWDPERLRAELSAIRKLTKISNPRRYIPRLIELCAHAGVAVEIVPTPPKCRASGATFFLNPHRAVMQLSLRYKADDQFWFTVFHEIGHLLLHDYASTYVEGLECTPDELEADEFAASNLIPLEFQDELGNLRPRMNDVVRFATRVGVSPGVVVGQLQYHQKISHKQLNFLKRRISWQDITL